MTSALLPCFCLRLIDHSSVAMRLLPPRVPDAHRLVRRGAGQALAVGAEAHAHDPAMVPLEDEELLAALRVPDPHRHVIAGRGQALAVGAEAHAGDLAGVAP